MEVARQICANLKLVKISENNNQSVFFVEPMRSELSTIVKISVKTGIFAGISVR